MSQIKIGSIIKSLDFAGMSGNYMVGRVVKTEFNGEIIYCDTIEIVRNNKSSSDTSKMTWFKTMAEGSCFMDAQHPGRVTVLE